MKYRKIILGLIFSFICPVVCDASACTVVSGTGNDIGDEIACGSEHFYILEKNENTIKMLAKYNLYVGDKIVKDSETYNVGEDYASAETAVDERCSFLAETYGPTNVESTGKFTEDGNPTELFCRIYIPLEYEEVKQSELAIGLFPNKNKEILYPIYGSIDLDEEVGDKEYDENMDLIPETSQFNSYLKDYTKTLTNIGVNVLDIGFIKKTGIENVINNVSDKKITIPTYTPWSNEVELEDNMWGDLIFDWYYEKPMFKFNIRDYVPEKYTWLYGTTYWVGSATKDESYYYDEFLSTVADYCSYVRGCDISRMGVGLRPVVAIDVNNIVVENKNSGIKNPKTSDNFYCYIVIGFISLLSICCIKKYHL